MAGTWDSQNPKTGVRVVGGRENRPLEKLTQICEEFERHTQLPISEDSAGLKFRRALIAPDIFTVGAQELFFFAHREVWWA